MRAQGLRDSSMFSYTSKKTLELNSRNPVVKELKKKVAGDKKKSVRDLTYFLSKPRLSSYLVSLSTTPRRSSSAFTV